MRLRHFVVTLFLALLSYAKESPKPILVSHNDIKGLDNSQARTEDLQVFADGTVKYEESGYYSKKLTFDAKLTPKKLQRLTALLDGRAMRAVPARIGSKIRVIDGRWDKALEIHRAGTTQKILIENFYPQLNSHRPAYPRVLVELECTLEDIQRNAANRPAPSDVDDWCHDALGKR